MDEESKEDLREVEEALEGSEKSEEVIDEDQLAE